MPTELGNKIKQLRQNKGYTLEKLAELTNSSKSYIWELENKNPPRPSAEKVSKIAEQLDVTIEYLINENSQMSAESASDAKFYSRYQKLDEDVKEKIREYVDFWDDKKK